jgi:2-desacetyl-2-hydroxyethyl bacteriochlorophyllide A dehydrogenase
MPTMKASRIFGPHDMRRVDVPVPEVGPRDVLCKVLRAGVCGTDYAIYSGEFSFVKNGAIKFPMTPGHEWSGVVEKIGPEVTGFKVGDRVVSDTGVACGECYDCLVGQYNRCKKGRAVGTINCWDGAYGEYILMPQRHLFHLPDNVTFDQGAFIEPSGIALYAVHLARVGVGDSVLVHGSGPIGILAAKLAKLCGATTVAITGRKDFKLQKALDLGIDAAVNLTREPLREAARNLVGPDGFDKIIEASGSTELFSQSFDVIKVGGVMSVVAFYERMVDRFDIDKFVFGNVTIVGAAGSLAMNRPVLNLMASGMLDPAPLITSRRPHREAAQAMLDMKEKNETRIKIILEA